jgi:hypothetical protein
MRPPGPPFTPSPAGGLDALLEREGYLVLHRVGTPQQERLLAEWLTRAQGRWRLTIEQVPLVDGGEGLLIVRGGRR